MRPVVQMMANLRSVPRIIQTKKHEQLRQHSEHLTWLESDGHSLGQTASGLRKKIAQLEKQIETLRATGRFP